MALRAPFLWLALALAAPAFAEPGRSAPDCALRTLAADEARSLRGYEGQFLWVDFWASWCGSCVESFPFLDDLARELGGRGLRVVGINVGESRDEARAFLERHPVDFTQLADPSGACPRSFGVEGMPSAYLIDPRGVIRLERRGFRPGEAAALRARIEQLIAREASAAP